MTQDTIQMFVMAIIGVLLLIYAVILIIMPFIVMAIHQQISILSSKQDQLMRAIERLKKE